MFYHLNKCLILHRGTIAAQQWCTQCMIYIKSLHITLFFIKLQFPSHSRTADVGVHSQEDLIQSAQGRPDQRKEHFSVWSVPVFSSPVYGISLQSMKTKKKTEISHLHTAVIALVLCRTQELKGYT